MLVLKQNERYLVDLLSFRRTENLWIRLLGERLGMLFEGLDVGSSCTLVPPHRRMQDRAESVALFTSEKKVTDEEAALSEQLKRFELLQANIARQERETGIVSFRITFGNFAVGIISRPTGFMIHGSKNPTEKRLRLEQLSQIEEARALRKQAAKAREAERRLRRAQADPSASSLDDSLMSLPTIPDGGEEGGSPVSHGGRSGMTGVSGASKLTATGELRRTRQVYQESRDYRYVSSTMPSRAQKELPPLRLQASESVGQMGFYNEMYFCMSFLFEQC